MRFSCILFLRNGMPCLYVWNELERLRKSMSRNRQARAPRAGTAGRSGRAEQVLDLDRYVPALITFIANKLSRSATVVYQKRFGVNVTEWRIMSLLAIEPAISAARICSVIGFDKGPVSRTLAVMEKRGLVSIRRTGTTAAPMRSR